VSAPDALLFDFDGLILDTETCTYEAVVEIFAEHGEHLDPTWWHSILGTADQLGRPVDRPALVAQREARRLPRIHALPACEGVEALLDAAGAAGLACAVVSSSAADWVVPHLDRLGLRQRFSTVVTRDDVGGDAARTKPAPDLYLVAAEALGARPARCVVFEDSPNGVAAGGAAGMAVVAVPSPMTRTLDLRAADLVVASLAELDLAVLASLVSGR
jgi:HAD superfamily hydrolase (TIGR01509 family)